MFILWRTNACVVLCSIDQNHPYFSLYSWQCVDVKVLAYSYVMWTSLLTHETRGLNELMLFVPQMNRCIAYYYSNSRSLSLWLFTTLSLCLIYSLLLLLLMMILYLPAHSDLQSHIFSILLFNRPHMFNSPIVADCSGSNVSSVNLSRRLLTRRRK